MLFGLKLFNVKEPIKTSRTSLYDEVFDIVEISYWKEIVYILLNTQVV